MQHSLHKELVNKDTSLRVLPHEKGCAVKQTGGSIPVSYTALVSENASTQTVSKVSVSIFLSAWLLKKTATQNVN